MKDKNGTRFVELSLYKYSFKQKFSEAYVWKIFYVKIVFDTLKLNPSCF